MRTFRGSLAVLWICQFIVVALLATSPAALAQQAPPKNEGSTKLTQSDIDRMLPPTDMGAGVHAARDASPSTASMSTGPATPFDSARIPNNPAAPDAQPVGAKTCNACHALEDLHASHAMHVQSFQVGTSNTGPQAACEACHGPGSDHAKNPTAKGSIIAFTHGSASTPETQATVCLGCHTGGARQHWLGSVHEARGLSCTDCHNPMVRNSPEGALAKSSINQVCATCHQDVLVKFNRRSHMPLPEGQMACTDCHNPHGSITKPLLKTDTVNETCYTCHAEKRGPFIFEHAPVRENCLNCHDPHGSNQQTLLVLPLPMLCQQCHTMNGHPNDLQTRQSMRNGLTPDERLMGRACVTCHTNIHGSNSPSGSMFHQ